ncbi:MAG TPA: hypothetical protein VHE33_10060 [Acidobacteriaceae bacterium]|nr:hypothetical protein [Acidobacteriaceae bacterium]
MSVATVATSAKPARTRKLRAVATGEQPAVTETPAPANPTPDTDALVKDARRYVKNISGNAVKLAGVLVDLYQVKPWNAEEITLKEYMAGLGIGAGTDLLTLPVDARRAVVSQMFTLDANASIDDIALLTGAGKRTIARDKSDLGFANPNRVESHTGPRNTDDTDDPDDTDGATSETTPAAPAAKAAMTPQTVMAWLDTQDDQTIADIILGLADDRAETVTDILIGALNARAAAV